jgi:hypothetical protein
MEYTVPLLQLRLTRPHIRTSVLIIVSSILLTLCRCCG